MPSLPTHPERCEYEGTSGEGRTRASENASARPARSQEKKWRVTTPRDDSDDRSAMLRDEAAGEKRVNADQEGQEDKEATVQETHASHKFFAGTRRGQRGTNKRREK